VVVARAISRSRPRRRNRNIRPASFVDDGRHRHRVRDNGVRATRCHCSVRARMKASHSSSVRPSLSISPGGGSGFATRSASSIETTLTRTLSSASRGEAASDMTHCYRHRLGRSSDRSSIHGPCARPCPAHDHPWLGYRIVYPIVCVRFDRVTRHARRPIWVSPGNGVRLTGSPDARSNSSPSSWASSIDARNRSARAQDRNDRLDCFPSTTQRTTHGWTLRPRPPRSWKFQTRTSWRRRLMTAATNGRGRFLRTG
jgi:hypothetical protein